MLITFDDDGSVEFTRNSDLLGLFPDDKKRITRMSLIDFDTDGQFFYIRFATGPFKGKVLSWQDGLTPIEQKLLEYWLDFAEDHSRKAVNLHVKHGHTLTRIVQFDTYEDAVKIEIAFIDYLREQGYSFR